MSNAVLEAGHGGILGSNSHWANEIYHPLDGVFMFTVVFLKSAWMNHSGLNFPGSMFSFR